MRTTAATPLNQQERRRHKWRNVIHSILLLGGMVGLLAVCALFVVGPDGVLWALLGGAIGLGLGPRASPRWVLAMYRARPIGPHEMPAVAQALDALSRRAGLARSPALFYVPSATLNAFAVGSREDAAIAVTDGMLRTLSLRELAGVLAHEISHVRNNDLWVMSLADTISRLTSFMAFAGIFLLFLSLPLLMLRGADVPWLLIALLFFAPTLGSLLQLALSRAREFDADLDAAGLTGDPLGLASALGKLERYQGRYWEELVMPGRRMPVPSLLRTHPPTEERVRRLAALTATAGPEPVTGREPFGLPQRFAPVRRRPQWHVTGGWY